MAEELYVCAHPTLGSWKCVMSQLAKTQGNCPIARSFERVNRKVTDKYDFKGVETAFTGN
jgi:hypothetical protein